MRLVTFVSRDEAAKRHRIGALIDGDEWIVDFSPLAPSDPAFSSMIGLMEGGPNAFDRAHENVKKARATGRDNCLPRDRVQLMAPVPRPVTLRDFACFPDHLVNIVKAIHRNKLQHEKDPQATWMAWEKAGVFDLPKDYYELPRFHSSNPNAVIGPDETAFWPRFSTLMDFELEFGFFIGRKGVDIKQSEARDYIFGYTGFIDFTARDMQIREGRPGGKGKEFDSGSVLGPCLVTADEIPNPYELKMESRVNGEVWCSGSSATIGRTFEQVIEHISDSCTIYPGEFMGSGTHGNGSGFEIGKSLSPGDEVEIEIEKIGLLKTRLEKRH